MFHTPPPKTLNVHDWQPPPNFSPTKVFPSAPPFQPEINDVDMAEVSPPKADEKEGDGGRVVALGGLRRVFNSRRKARGQSQASRSRDGRDEADSGSENDVEDDVVFSPPINTSNHYTLNMSNAPAAHSDMPYILLGCVNSSCGAKCNWRSLV
jgi:hypothetical protein